MNGKFALTVAGAIGMTFASGQGLAHATVARTISNGHVTVTFDDRDPDFNPELVTGISWVNSSSTTSDYVSNGGSGCDSDPTEFFGQSYDFDQGESIDAVVAGFRGTWSADTARTESSGQESPTLCPGSNNPVPVDTSYIPGAAGRLNQVQITRIFHFGSDYKSGAKLRVYVPRIPLSTYGQVEYPTKTGMLGTTGATGPATVSDWAGTWYADNDSADNHGMLVFVDSANPGTAELETDNDSSSASNNSSIIYTPPGDAGANWSDDQAFKVTLCFYDATTWPVDNRATTTPAGCGYVPPSIHRVAITPSVNLGGLPGATATFPESGVDPAVTSVRVCWVAGNRADSDPTSCSHHVDVPVDHAHESYSSGFFPVDQATAVTFSVFTVTATDSETDYGLPVSFDRAGTATSMAGAPKSAPYRAARTLTTTLKGFDPNPAAVPNQPIELWRKVAKTGSVWKRLTTVVGNSQGAAAHRVVETTPASYQWRYQGAIGDTNLLASVSQIFRTAVTFVVHAALTHPRVKVGKPVSIYGTVTPGATGKSVKLQEFTHHSWSTIASQKLAKRLLPSSKKRKVGYQFALSTSHRGSRTYRVLKPAGSGYSAGIGSPHTVTVS